MQRSIMKFCVAACLLLVLGAEASLLQSRARARVQARSKIVHEVFSSLAERRSREAQKAESVADQASAALAQIRGAKKGGKALSEVEKALEAVEAEQSSETKVAKEAGTRDAADAAQSKGLEQKMDRAMGKADAAAGGLDKYTGVEAIILGSTPAAAHGKKQQQRLPKKK